MHRITLILALISSSPAFANDLVPASTPVNVARSDLQVSPDRDWNKLDARPGRNSETWTLDGELLNDVSFYGGTENNRTLFREVDRRNRPLPRFTSTMLPTDIPTLLENSYRIARDVSIFTLDSQEPIRFAGNPGIRFTYSFIGRDNLHRSGEAHAAIIDGRLYMATFEAPSIHYFANGIAAFRHIAASAHIARPARRR